MDGGADANRSTLHQASCASCAGRRINVNVRRMLLLGRTRWRTKWTKKLYKCFHSSPSSLIPPRTTISSTTVQATIA